MQMRMAPEETTENAGPGDGAPPDFDAAMTGTFKTVSEAVAADEAANPEATAPDAQTATAVTPAVVPTPAEVASPDYMQEILRQNQQMMAQMTAAYEQMARAMTPAPKEEPPAPAPKAPTAAELARTFQPPARTQGEAEESYLARAQGLMLDHINSGVITHMEKLQEQRTQAAIQQYHQQLLEQGNQYTRRAQGEQAWVAALDASIKQAGFDPTSEHGKTVREAVDHQLRFRAQQLGQQASQVTDAQWSAAMGHLAGRFKSMAGPPALAATGTAAAVIVPPSSPGQQPKLQLVAPISGPGNSTPSQPASGAPPIPKNYNEAMDNLWAGVQKSIG